MKEEEESTAHLNVSRQREGGNPERKPGAGWQSGKSRKERRVKQINDEQRSRVSKLVPWEMSPDVSEPAGLLEGQGFMSTGLEMTDQNDSELSLERKESRFL